MINLLNIPLSSRRMIYSGAQKGRNDFVSNFTNKVVSSFLATTVYVLGVPATSRILTGDSEKLSFSTSVSKSQVDFGRFDFK